jgi:hypothetical protein
VPRSVITAVVIVAMLTFALAGMLRNGCHFNVHLTKRIYCTDPGR